MFSKFKKKKTALGMEVKPRTKEEIDHDYIHNSVQLAHKMRVIKALTLEVDEHIKKLDEISEEGAAREKMEGKPEGTIVAEEQI